LTEIIETTTTINLENIKAIESLNVKADLENQDLLLENSLPRVTKLLNGKFENNDPRCFRNNLEVNVLLDQRVTTPVYNLGILEINRNTTTIEPMDRL
jgi:hypothetical protein